MKAFHSKLAALLVALLWCVISTSASAQCKVSEAKRKFEGAERNIVTMENAKIVVEIAPELEGRIIRYAEKGRPGTPLEWLDDCPYHFAGRWEGKPFTHRVVAREADKGVVTVSGGGKIAVALLRSLGYDVANPLDLTVERTMTIEPNSTRLRIDVKITNSGEGVAPQLRYMVHSVYGQVPQLAGGGRAYWFLPTAQGVEFFDDARGNREMQTASSGAAADHPFNRFTKGHKADKPRYEAAGWGAVLTSAGPNYIYYDPKQFDFMQYWFGGDSEWHFTFEPHSKPVDLKPGESVDCSFTLAFDSGDVPFNTSTISYEQPRVTDVATPGGTIGIKSRATTVALNKTNHAELAIEIKDPSGKAILSQAVQGEVKLFELTDLAASAKLPADAPLGHYTWTAKLEDGKTLASGKVEVVSASDLERRRAESATAAIKAQFEGRVRTLELELSEARKAATRWNEGVNLALSLNDRRVWPSDSAPSGSLGLTIRRGVVPVDGLWKANESVRFKRLRLAANPKLESTADDALKTPWAGPNFRDAALTPDGKRVVVLLVDAAKSSTEVVSYDLAGGAARRFGRFSDKPAETDDSLGAVARALAVDADGNIWIATNAWGQTSRYGLNQDGAPFEESIVGAKGAVKKFSPEGKLLGAISMLDAPMDLALVDADGQPALLASYRHVSSYYGAQVKEGVMIIAQADARRLAEIKIPAGSVTVDSDSRIWSADVAGHIAAFDIKGRKLLDVAASAKPAVLDAKLPVGTPLPVVLRAAPQGGVWALATLKRSLTRLDAEGKGTDTAAPNTAGALWKVYTWDEPPRVAGEAGWWSPSK